MSISSTATRVACSIAGSDLGFTSSTGGRSNTQSRRSGQAINIQWKFWEVSELMIADSMQIVCKNEDEKSSSGRINLVDFVICARRISRYVEREYVGGFGRRI